MVEDSKIVHGNDYGRMNWGQVIDYIGYKYPVEGWIKLNVDGCSKSNPEMTDTGGMIRDHMGFWIGGFVRDIGICSSVTAKL